MIILDTHVLIWFAEDVSDLGRRAAAEADEALQRDALAVSAISFWEIAMLARKGRLALTERRRRCAGESWSRASAKSPWTERSA